VAEWPRIGSISIISNFSSVKWCSPLNSTGSGAFRQFVFKNANPFNVAMLGHQREWVSIVCWTNNSADFTPGCKAWRGAMAAISA
jgi:hypothetical protein